MHTLRLTREHAGLGCTPAPQRSLTWVPYIALECRAEYRMVTGAERQSLVVLRVSLRGGEYDVFRREELRAELDAIDTDTDIELDLSATSLMDAGAVGLLAAFRRRVVSRNPRAKVRLLNAAPIVRKILSVSKVDALFELVP